MGHRIALAALAVLTLWGSRAAAGVLPRAAMAQVLVGHPEAALDLLEVSGETGRTAHYLRAAALLELGAGGKALALLDELARSGGAFAGPALELAVGDRFGAGDVEGVVARMGAAAPGRYQDENALRYRVGQSYFLLGRPKEARAELEEVTAGPYLPYALHTLALVHFNAGRLREAIEVLARGIEAAAADSTATGAALADRLRLARGQVIYQAASGLQGAEGEERQRLYGTALEQFDLIPRKSPFYPEALRGAGWCALELGKAVEALAAFEAAAVLDPGSRDRDRWAQGRAYQRLGYQEEAVRSYREARAEALVEAEEEGTAQPRADPEIAAWELRRRSVEEASARLDALGEREVGVASAIEARRSRLEAMGSGLDRLRGRLRTAAADLDSLGANRKDYLDRLPASALLPRNTRAHMADATRAQERLATDLSRAEDALIALSSSGLWQEAPPGVRARGEALWARLRRALGELEGAQLSFLLALKGRVTEGEAELARALGARRTTVGSLEQASDRLAGILAAELEHLAGLNGRLEAISARREELDGLFREVRGRVRETLEGLRRERAADRSRRLRLRADAYALDEAQALHLLREHRP